MAPSSSLRLRSTPCSGAGSSSDGGWAAGRRAKRRRDDEGVIAEIRRLSGTDTSLLDDDDVVRMILPALRGDYRAIETYAYQSGPRLTCPVTAFVSDRDPQVTMDEARAWQEHTTGEFRLQ